MSVLAVGAGKLSLRGDELASSETADRGAGARARARVGEPAPVFRKGQALAEATRAKIFHKFKFNHYIRVLLIKTNPMIYNMLYKR